MDFEQGHQWYLEMNDYKLVIHTHNAIVTSERISPMGDGMTGIARQDKRPPLYAVIITIIAKVYTMKNILRSRGHFCSSPSGKENNKKMSKSKETRSGPKIPAGGIGGKEGGKYNIFKK